MAYIDIKDIQIKLKGKEVKLLRQLEFAKKYANGISKQAVTHAMDNGSIDWTRLDGGKERLVVLTDKTLQYTPRADGGSQRSRMETSA